MVLQQRVRAVPVERHDLAAHEWIGGGRRHEQQEEGDHREEDRERGRREARERRRATPGDVCRGPGEDRGPEQDRPLERGPQRDDGEEERRLERVVPRDVRDREVVRDERPDHRERGEDNEKERDERRPTRTGERPAVALRRRACRGADAPDRERQRRAERARAEVREAEGHGVWWLGVVPGDGGAYRSSCFAITCVARNVPSVANVPSTTAPAPSRSSAGGAPEPMTVTRVVPSVRTKRRSRVCGSYRRVPAPTWPPSRAAVPGGRFRSRASVGVR